MAAPAGRVCHTQTSLQSIDSLVHMRQVSFPRHVCEPARDLIRNLLQSMCACVLSLTCFAHYLPIVVGGLLLLFTS